jgi:hypothetical protein
MDMGKTWSSSLHVTPVRLAAKDGGSFDYSCLVQSPLNDDSSTGGLLWSHLKGRRALRPQHCPQQQTVGSHSSAATGLLELRSNLSPLSTPRAKSEDRLAPHWHDWTGWLRTGDGYSLSFIASRIRAPDIKCVLGVRPGHQNGGRKGRRAARPDPELAAKGPAKKSGPPWVGRYIGQRPRKDQDQISPIFFYGVF